ncbi:MAG: pilus assembly protein TadG-related protein, partial [Candidatus Dormibacteraceae bacterium]
MSARSESGQVMVLVAFALLALIGTAALVLVAGSVEWQKNQLQQLADEAALESALSIGVGCNLASATAVIDTGDAFVASQRTGGAATPTITGASCSAGYSGTNGFTGGLSETINYPYHQHQQQVEVVLTLSVPISFGSELRQTSTSVSRRAVAQQMAGSTTALSAGTLTCTGGQVDVAGSIATQSAIALNGTCTGIYAHARLDAASATYSDLGNVSVYTAAQPWVTGVGHCTPAPSAAICADGYEISGNTTTSCGTNASEYLSAGDKLINPDPCAAGTSPQPVATLPTAVPPEPNADSRATGTLQGTGGSACSPAATYPTISAGGITFG